MQKLEEVIQRESKTITNFFQTSDIEIPKPPAWINDKVIQNWSKLIFDIHYLPNISMEERLDLTLWKDRPSKHFYKKINEGKISQDAKKLLGKWILIDIRDKPSKKVFWVAKNDVWILEKMGFRPKNYFKRKNKQLHQEDYLSEILKQRGFGSRFCLSINDIKKIMPLILDIVNINNKGAVIRLPRFIEYNYLGNTFYKQWDSTQTWEWFEDRFDKIQYLAGGSKSVGCIGWDPPEFWSTILTFRPLIEL